MDKIVIDIETSNSFQEVGGGRNLKSLDVSFIGAYSYKQDEYLSFFEDELDAFGELLRRTGLIIGFSINNFDIPVLEKYYHFNLRAIPRLDILEEFELAAGYRVSLDILSRANLGEGKTHSSGLESIRLYREGRMEELKNYCLQDVKLTKDLYELIKEKKYLTVPDRFTQEPIKVPVEFSEDYLPATLF
jgi:DEAD/DEAH box helicase domain-containing protein